MVHFSMELYLISTDYTLIQYGMKHRLKYFSQDLFQEVLKYMIQLHYRDVLDPYNPNTLICYDRRELLECLIFLKHNIDIISSAVDYFTFRISATT